MVSPPDPRLLKGIDEFNRGLFFECHETLEQVWLEEHGSDRLFYQGIIQIAAAYYKWEQAVPMGTIKLMRAGLEKIEAYGPMHLGVDLGAFAAAVRDQLQQIEACHEGGEEVPELRAPRLSLNSERAGG